MWTRISQQYSNLSIRLKIFSTIGLLLALGIAQIIILLYTTAIQNDAETEFTDIQVEIDLARNMQNHSLVARNHETAVGLVFLRDGLPAIGDEVALALTESQLASNYLSDLQTSDKNKSTEELNILDNITTDLDEYQATVNIMINKQIAVRGNMEDGLGGDVMRPLNTVNEQVDATATLTLISNYIETVDPAVIMQIPASMGALKTKIDESEQLNTEEKTHLKNEVQSAQTAFLALANHDLNILNNVNLIATLSDQIIADLDTYIELKLDEQAKAQKRLDNIQQDYLYLQYVSLSAVAVLALLLSYVLAKSINDPLQNLTQTSNLIA